MKKFLMVLLILFVTLSVFSSTGTKGGFSEQGSADVEASINRTDYGYVQVKLATSSSENHMLAIGFSSTAVKDNYQSISNKESVKLSTTASGSTADNAADPLYVYWQIRSDDILSIKLTADSYMKETENNYEEKTEGSSLGWKITVENSGEKSDTVVDSTSSIETTANPIELYSNSTPQYHSASDSRKIEILTGDFSAYPDNYFMGQIKVTVSGS